MRWAISACIPSDASTTSTLGVPDIGILTQSEIIERARRINGTVSIPLVADMDTGYGNPVNVVRTVQECVALGAAGIILEDQLWPKKCGHMEGKVVIPLEEQVEKLRAAVYARGDSGLVIIGRTDARGPHGLEEEVCSGRTRRCGFEACSPTRHRSMLPAVENGSCSIPARLSTC